MVHHAASPTQLPLWVEEPAAPTFSRRIFAARHWLVVALIGAGALLIPSTTMLASLDPAASDLLIMAGTALIAGGAALRIWAGLYIGGRKNLQVVRDGPYALSRNPLYLGNLLAAAGIVLLSGSIVVAGLVLPAACLVFLLTIRSEEANLVTKFGPAYLEYRAAVPRFLPTPRAIGRFLADETPTRISHRNMARELRRGALVIGLGLLAFILGSLPV
jgi:protein-S-isoprenylcysteine O-methyltransferase Ste14